MTQIKSLEDVLQVPSLPIMLAAYISLMHQQRPRSFAISAKLTMNGCNLINDLIKISDLQNVYENQ
jgi:hypothetical protein